MGGCEAEVGGEGAGLRVARSEGQFRRQDAGGAGAEEDADPVRAVAFPCRSDRFGEAVLA